MTDDSLAATRCHGSDDSMVFADQMSLATVRPTAFWRSRNLHALWFCGWFQVESVHCTLEAKKSLVKTLTFAVEEMKFCKNTLTPVYTVYTRSVVRRQSLYPVVVGSTPTQLLSRCNGHAGPSSWKHAVQVQSICALSNFSLITEIQHNHLTHCLQMTELSTLIDSHQPIAEHAPYSHFL